MIFLTEYQLARLADHFSKTMTNEELFKVKFYNDGRPRYSLIHGIHKKVFLRFEDPAYETAFRLRFAEFLTAEHAFSHITVKMMAKTK